MNHAPAAPRAIPHNKLIRAWLAPISGRSTVRALALVVSDLLLYAACLAAALLAPHPVLQALAGLATGLVISRLFILGHDACHQSLTRHRTLNRWLGRLIFLPSLTPYSLWEVGHNVVQPFSWRWYADTVRRCKLYDFDAKCCTDFSGRPTGLARQAAA